MKSLRRHATTIVICVASLAALAAVLIWDRGSVTTGESMARKKDLFDAWRLDDVSEVTVKNKGRTARLVRAATNDAGQKPWNVEIDRVEHSAEEQIVDQFFGTLEFATAERRVAPEGIDRKEMRLDSPRETIEIKMGKQNYFLAVGGPAASPEGAVYVEVKGRGVSVISAELLAALDVTPETFRSRSFVPYVSTDLATIELVGTGGRRKLARAKWAGSRDPGFAFAEGEPLAGVRVASAPLDRILVALADLQAEAFLSAEEGKAASKPDVFVTLVPSDSAKKTVKIEIGGACPNKPESVVAVRDQPSLAFVCVPKAPLDAFTVTADALADHRLVGAPADEITEVKLDSDGKVLEVARSGSEWHVRRPNDLRADADAGKIFLGGLLLASGETLGRDAVTAKSTARIVSLRSTAEHDAGPNERIEELSWGDAVDGKVLVKRSEDGATLSVAADLMAKFRPSDLALRSRKVIDEPLEELRSLRVEGGGRVQKIERDESTFTLIEPKGEGLAADAGLTSDLAQAVLSLTAEQWVADQDDGTHGLGTPRFTIEVELGEAGDAGVRRKVRLTIGASAAAGSFALKEGDAALFVVPRALEVAANRWLVDRTALAVDAPQIASATLRAGGKKIELEQRGSAWELRGAAGNADAQAVHDVLADLSADGAVSVGKAKSNEGMERPSIEVEIKRTAGESVKLTFGASDTFEGASVVYARRKGIDATYAVSKSKLKAILDALGIP